MKGRGPHGRHADFLYAKRALLRRWAPPLRRAVDEARALRRRRQFRPDVPLNLVGVGVGEKVTAGRRTGEACVKVLVARKYPLGRIPLRQRIPSRVAGMITDVEEVGYPRALPVRVLHALASHRPGRRGGSRGRGAGARGRRRAADLDPLRRRRPVPGGVSVGLDRGAVPYRFAGTLGVVLSDRSRPALWLGLSNNHVLANENQAPLGAGVIQPGSLDGGKEVDRIGTLERFEPLRFGNRPNSMDAAVAAFGRGAEGAAEILGLGAPTGVAEPELEMRVRKMGRTTGLTEGIVRAVRFDVTGVEYEQGMVRVDDVVVIEGARGKFSDAGDSGSAILDGKGRLVALLFAGSPRVTFAIPMPRIFKRLRLRLPPRAAARR
jgi:hypothetical protein